MECRRFGSGERASPRRCHQLSQETSGRAKEEKIEMRQPSVNRMINLLVSAGVLMRHRSPFFRIIRNPGKGKHGLAYITRSVRCRRSGNAVTGKLLNTHTFIESCVVFLSYFDRGGTLVLPIFNDHTRLTNVDGALSRLPTRMAKLLRPEFLQVFCGG